jgi:AcrR family transcriptional regulator
VPRPPDGRRRRELLDAVIEAVADQGIGGRSLRDIADAVGTSHRMLLHHFGSREELLLAIVEEVERRQTATRDRLPDDPARGFAGMWADLLRPELRSFERLYFECYARAAQGEAPFTRLLPGAVDGWLEAVADRTEGTAEADLVRLCLAVTRGLLLDLVGTADVAGVGAAAGRFVRMLEQQDAPAGRSSGPRDAE